MNEEVKELTAEAQRRQRKNNMKELTGKIIGAAIEVHKALGPGLLESACEECLAHEMHLSGLCFQRQVPLPVCYKGANLDCGYRALCVSAVK